MYMKRTISQVKRILGKESKQFSDIELEDLINQFYLLAEVIAETVTKHGSKKSK